MNSKSMIITVVVALLVGGASFYGGMLYQKSQVANRMMSFSANGGPRSMQFGQGQGGPGGRAMTAQGMRPVSGEIISLDDTGATVKMPDGSSKIVIISDKTTVSKTSEATKTDLKTGETITAFGTSNADGSITAQNISVGNMMFRTFQRTESGTQQGGTSAAK